MATRLSDPIGFELFKNTLLSIADEMALTILRTAYSGVLKDNMDYSTAFCDAQGRTVAQGLTLPGHLGSMPTAMASVQQTFAGNIHPGDVFAFNDPFRGGKTANTSSDKASSSCNSGLRALRQTSRDMGRRRAESSPEKFKLKHYRPASSRCNAAKACSSVSPTSHPCRSAIAYRASTVCGVVRALNCIVRPVR